MENLNQLTNQAAALDGDVIADAMPPIAEAGAVVEQVPDMHAEARDLIGFGVTLFAPLYPSLAAVYTPEKQERLAAVSVPLMQKYNITFAGLFEKWGAEINFAIVAVPLAGETLRACRADNAARKEAEEKENAAKNQPAQ